jgi:ABC-type multidrug transport system ATPase subunit
MKTCIACQTINADTNSLCKQCGLPLFKGDSSGPTLRYTGPLPSSAPKGPGALITLSSLFAGKQRLVIGRASDCDICLPHPMVSRYHALLEQPDGQLHIRDLASVNGVWANGRRITEPVVVREGERIGIGPFLFKLREGVIHSVDSSKSMRLEAQSLEKIVPIEGGQTRKLLDNINLVVNPGEFVSLLGPSGSGKSTLMDCLNGRRRATGGRVLANGEDFYRHFDNFRQSLGYVPQKDIVHTQLTVYRALYYTAQLRLPTDTDPAELRARIEAVIAEMELDPHRNTLVANLSGGQIKRVSLGAELLAQPCMLYIDEATSGLDAGTEARMMRLFRRLADEGRSLICITHNVDNVDQCHLILVLARGKLIYFGPPAEAPIYFGVDRVSEMYDRLSTKDVAEWEKQYRDCSLYKDYIGNRVVGPSGSRSDVPPLPVAPPPSPAPPSAELPAPAPLPTTPPEPTGAPALADRIRTLTSRALRFQEYLGPMRMALHQFLVLTARYLDLVIGDPRGLRLLLLQAPIVALFLLVGFLDKDFQKVVPRPRPLHENEKKLLHALDTVSKMIVSEQEPGKDETKALQEMKIVVPVAGVRTTIDGLQLLPYLRAFSHMPANDDTRKQLETARIIFTAHGETSSLSLADLVDLSRTLQQEEMMERLRKSDLPLVPGGDMVNPRFTYMLLFVLVMIVMWFGCNNAAKEIVKEEAIYGRERAVNLGIIPYLGSKFLVLSLITIFHAFLLMGLLYGTLHLLHWFDPTTHSVPYPGHMLGYASQFGVLTLLSMTGVALGLLLSACVATPDRANALLPYVLIPQMILGGGLLTVDKGLLYSLAFVFSPVYWAYRAVHLGASELPKGFPGYSELPNNLWLPCQALVIQMVVLMLLAGWFLRRKDA